MDSRHLHPNLARLAASYDDILEQFTRNQLSAEAARQRISALVCRDDQGVQWCISPDDGQWYRVTMQNQLVRDEPPEVGLATYTGWDLSGGDPMADPRHRIIDQRVDPRELHDAASLVGSTARFVRNQADEQGRVRRRSTGWVVLTATLAVAAAVSLWLALGHDDPAPVVRTPAPTAPAGSGDPAPGVVTPAP